MEQGFISIDVGTQSIRTSFVNTDMKILAIHSDPQEIHTSADGNRIEVNIQNVWNSICSGIRSLLQNLRLVPSSVLGICVGAIMHCPVPIDFQGKLLLQNVQIYSDKRAKELVREYQKSEEAALAYEMTGNIPTASWMGFKIRWIKDNQPDIYIRTYKFLSASSFIVYRLTGRPCIDVSEASGTYLTNILNEKEWDPWLMNKMELDVEKMPGILYGWEKAGYVTESVSELTGLLPNTPVMVGGGDMGCAGIVSGNLNPGDCMVTTGTASGASMFCNEPIRDPAVINLRHIIDGWLAFGSVECGGGSMTWLRKNLFKDAEERETNLNNNIFDYINDLADSVPAGSNGLLYLPQLLGERENLGSPDSKGAFIGISFGTNLSHFTRALMEGVCYAERRILDAFLKNGADVKFMFSRGGGTNSRVWNQIRCDIYQMPIYVLEDSDTSGLVGAALLAGKGIGLFSDLAEEAKKYIKVNTVYYPNVDNAIAYQRMQEIYQEAHDSLLPTFQLMKQFLSSF